jgi:hypothetical protein
MYEHKGADYLKTFLRGSASSYKEAATLGGGYTTTFQFDNELSDFEFTADLDPRQTPLGPKGLQVQAAGLGPYLGLLASVNLAGYRGLLYAGSGKSATARARNIGKILLNELDAIEYDQGKTKASFGA